MTYHETNISRTFSTIDISATITLHNIWSEKYISQMRLNKHPFAHQYWHQNLSSGTVTLLFSKVLKHWNAGYAYPNTKL